MDFTVIIWTRIWVFCCRNDNFQLPGWSSIHQTLTRTKKKFKIHSKEYKSKLFYKDIHSLPWHEGNSIDNKLTRLVTSCVKDSGRVRLPLIGQFEKFDQFCFILLWRPNFHSHRYEIAQRTNVNKWIIVKF